MGEKGDGFETIEEPGGDPARTASTRSSAVAASDRPVWNRGSLSARSSRGFLPDRNLTSEPFARSSLGQETPPLCFGGCQSHQPQRIRVPGVSRLAQGGSRTIRTTPLQNERMEPVADARVVETLHEASRFPTSSWGSIHQVYPITNLTNTTTPPRPTWWECIARSTHAREDEASSSYSTCHPCVRLHT